MCCSILSFLGVVFYVSNHLTKAVFFITVLLQPQFLNIEIGKRE